MDISTKYLGFDLENPLIPGASPLSDDLDMVRRLEDAGAPMLVMHSVFQEQIEQEQVALNYGLDQGEQSFAEALSYLPLPEQFALGPDAYLEQIRRIKAAVKIPVVASLNGRTLGGWIDYARKIEQAGADALELNIYDPVLSLAPDSTTIELATLETIRAVNDVVTIPVAVKLSPFYTNMVHFAHRADASGIRGLVLFNRFYQPDINIETMELRRELKLSTSEELLPRLRWAAALWNRVDCDIAITGGVHTAEDVCKCVMAGASAVQLVSALLIHGPSHLEVLRRQLERWLEEHDYESLHQMRGSMSLIRTPNPSAYERGNYMKMLQNWSPDSQAAAMD
jgi:dihydroorotate dehydrogenase (fumarate)